MQITFLTFLSLLYYVTSFEFRDAKQPGVEFGNSTENTQNITVDEDNDGKITKVLTITGVSGDLSLTYDSTVKELLQPLVAKASEDEYALIINQLDYENLRSRSIKPYFIIDFSENDSSIHKTLNIEIKNIDDESPTLTSTHCVMEEEKYIIGNGSECVLHISDPDGWLASMDFTTIIGKEGNTSIFKLVYDVPPADDVYDYDVYVEVYQDSALKLDYETESFYVFEVQAKDQGGHPTTIENVVVVIEVGDISDQLPVWLNTKDTIHIDEETSTTIQLKAIDGDFGVNNDINYLISDSKGFLHIDSKTGIINVDPIDREGSFDRINFTVTAYEVQDPQSSITGTFTLIIDDIDDNIPLISVDGSNQKQLNISIPEGSTSIDNKFVVTDLDLGENAAFSINLTTSRIGYLNAFDIIPTPGYRNTSLELVITNPHLLDFENGNWKTIDLELYTNGTKNPSKNDVLAIIINLENVNDNTPFFDQDRYVVTISENATAGTVIASIQANDADHEDENGIQHEILGTSLLKMDPFSGNITIVYDNFFDYEQQNEYLFQIRATDKAGHSNTTQLVVQIEDVNDEPPQISPKLTIIEIEENSNSIPKTNITVSDADLTQELSFKIDWSVSFATKNSVMVTSDSRYVCFGVRTMGNDDNTYSAELYYTSDFNCVDYEMFDTLHLSLHLEDGNTMENRPDDDAIVVIKVIDVNDNAPVFEDFNGYVTRIPENAADETFILAALATDADAGDTITYSIRPNTSDTPNWVKIDPETSYLTVTTKEAGNIDCDDTHRAYLYYIITASDGKHERENDLIIDIDDVNDNAPTLDDQQLSIPEDTKNGTLLLKLEPEDRDRDEPNNVVECTFSPATTSDILNRFKIESNTLYLSLSNGITLDQEINDEYIIELDCYDNVGGTVSLRANPRPKVTISLTETEDEE